MREERHETNARRAGFTLIEVLLVVAILGILATVVVVNFSGKGVDARIKATRASIAAVCTAIDMYEVDTGRFPPSLKDLLADDGSPNWNGPYLRGSVPTDAWSTPLSYSHQSGSYKVISGGPDTQVGSADDITSF